MDVELLPCQYASKINGIWNGSLISACCLVIPKNSCASILENKKILAGNIEIKSIIIKIEHSFLYFLNNIPTDKIISAAPLTYTIISLNGR